MDEILPVLRSRADIDFALLQAALSGEALAAGDMPHRPVTDHLVVALGGDQGGGVTRFLTPHELEALGLTLDQGLDEAIHRMNAATLRPPQPAANGVYCGLGDGLDTARLLLPKFLRQADVRGDLLVAVPNRDTLLITGSDDEEGVDNLIQMSAGAYSSGRSMDARIYRLEGEDLHLWLPPADHRLYWKCRQLEFLTISSMYNQQKQMLDHLYGEATFVANLRVQDDLRGSDLPPVFSLGSWAEGAVTLLPKSDFISFVRFDGQGQPQDVVVVSWEEAERLVGGYMHPQGMYPERYRVEQFPSEAEWRSLQAKMVGPAERSFGEDVLGKAAGAKSVQPASKGVAVMLACVAVSTLLLTFALGLMTYASPRAGVVFAGGAVGVTGMLTAIAFLSGMVYAFRERVTSGLLYLFAPFYWLFFLCTRRDRTRPLLLLLFTSCGLFIASAVALMEGSYLARRRGRPISWGNRGPSMQPSFARGRAGRSRRGRSNRAPRPDDAEMPTLTPPPGFVIPTIPEITFPELHNKDYKPIAVQLWQVAVDPGEVSPAPPEDWKFQLSLKGDERIVASPPGFFVALLKSSLQSTRIQVVDLRDGSSVYEVERPGRVRELLVLSRDGKHLAGVAEDQRSVHVWSLDKAGARSLRVEPFAVPVFLTFLDEGRLLSAERSPSGVDVRIHDLTEGTAETYWSASRDTVEHRWAASPGGRYLAFAEPEEDGQVITVIELSTKKLAARLRFLGHDGFDAPPCRGLAFSPGGREFAVLMAESGAQPSRIIRMDVETGEQLSDHRVPRALDVFGLSPVAPGLQWVRPGTSWFVSEQWRVDCESGEVLDEPVGPIVGLSPFRRWAFDGGHVLHVDRPKPFQFRLLVSERPPPKTPSTEPQPTQSESPTADDASDGTTSDGATADGATADGATSDREQPTDPISSAPEPADG